MTTTSETPAPSHGTKPGDRVELERCTDPYTRLARGSRGTVTSIDSLGTLHVSWDSGARLGLIEGEDSWRVVQDERS